MKRYRYLLWDLDGTILDFAASESAAIRKLFRKYGLGECTDEMLAAYSAINVRWWQALERGEFTKPEILVGRFREFFRLEGIDEGLAERFNADYQPALGDTIVFRDDAVNVLTGLKSACVLAAVTNGTKEAQLKKLRVSGLDKIFDHVFISEDIGFEKPNRGFFDAVFRTMNITDPGQVLIIGDSLTSDIRGGLNAGIDTCWYNPAGKAPDPGTPASMEIRDLRELPAMLL